MATLTRTEELPPRVSIAALVAVALVLGSSGLVFAPRSGLVYLAAVPLGIAAFRLRGTPTAWRVGLAVSMLLFTLGALIGSALLFTVGFDVDDAFFLTDDTLVFLAVQLLPLLGLVVGVVSVAATLGRRTARRLGAA